MEEMMKTLSSCSKLPANFTNESEFLNIFNTTDPIFGFPRKPISISASRFGFEKSSEIKARVFRSSSLNPINSLNSCSFTPSISNRKLSDTKPPSPSSSREEIRVLKKPASSDQVFSRISLYVFRISTVRVRSPFEVSGSIMIGTTLSIFRNSTPDPPPPPARHPHPPPLPPPRPAPPKQKKKIFQKHAPAGSPPCVS